MIVAVCASLSWSGWPPPPFARTSRLLDAGVVVFTAALTAEYDTSGSIEANLGSAACASTWHGMHREVSVG